MSPVMCLLSMKERECVLLPCGIGVPDHHIGIRTLGDAALLGIEVEYFGGVAACYGHKPVFVHLSTVLRDDKVQT